MKSEADLQAIYDDKKDELDSILFDSSACLSQAKREGKVDMVDETDHTVRVTFNGANPMWFDSSMLTIKSPRSSAALAPAGRKRVYLQHVATGKFAVRGGSHWTARPEPEELWVVPDSQGRSHSDRPHHIRSANEAKQEFMRHYNGDADNFTQSYTDGDTAWKFEEATDGQIRIVNTAGSGSHRYLCVHPTADKLYVPNSSEQSDASQRLWTLRNLDVQVILLY